MATANTWTYNGRIINELSDMPENTNGIVYLITTEHGKKYLGKKTLFTKRKRKFGKKESALITDKRIKLWEWVIKESNWKSYTGSNKFLNEDIENGEKYTKKILYFATTKKQLGYLETKMLYVNEVLEKGDEYYNGNISGKFYRKDV